jgi:5-methylcytosine-specific restriction protein A
VNGAPALYGSGDGEKQVPKSRKLKKNSPRLKAAPDRLKAGDSWRATLPTANARGYTYQWQKARADHLQAFPLCEICQAEGVITAASVVNHRKPHNGDPVLFWDRTNWQSVCTHHHASDIQRAEHADKYGVPPRIN